MATIPLPQLQQLTFSSMSTFKRCRKLWEYKYVKGWIVMEENENLSIGSAFHEAINAWRLQRGSPNSAAPWEDVIEGSGLDAFNKQKVECMFKGYVNKYEHDDLDFVQSEEVFVVPLRNPESGRISRTWAMSGKRDGIVRLSDGRLALFETKTAKTPDDKYWARAMIDGQVNHYVISGAEQRVKFDIVIYDVVKKPGQKPLKATPIEKRKVRRDGQPYADIRMEDETPQEYGDRIWKAMMEDPESYFIRRELPRLIMLLSFAL